MRLNPPHPSFCKFWAIELAYNQGWQLPGQMSGSYNEFAQRWGNPGFTEYVTLLEKQANQVLPEASESIQQQAESAFLQVAIRSRVLANGV
ncbi:MAG: hypothetical protein RIB93_03135 [Coleofasciculus sp. D1-CHI-01]